MPLARAIAVLVGFTLAVAAAEPTATQVEFFEKRVRPILADKCYGCHNSKAKVAPGGLRLDTPEGLKRGGDSGPVVAPGDPEASWLIRAISYKHELRMPPQGKLADRQIEDLTAWVRDGAPDPRKTAVNPTSAVAGNGVDLTEARRFWAFQPVRNPAVPQTGAKSPIDAFLLAKLAEKGLSPAVKADRRTLIRRATFDLTGLPPTADEVKAFLDDNAPNAFEKVVDRLLASPQYGERWARHWLDLVRYAETNGHEYDNDKHEPWRYRDYVIRAFNSDLPYNQFVREHIAGDLLPSKRLRPDGGAYESPVATASFWFGEVLNSATDSEKSRADDVDNQIDVLSKAFLGLTVACARCHNHKFDPIPTRDYYSLAGILHSTELREALIDSPARVAKAKGLSEKITAIDEELARLQPRPKIEVKPIEYRPNDQPFERFDGSDYGKWVPEGPAFGNAPSNGGADSRAAGSDVFMGTLTSRRFHTGKQLYLHVRIGGTKTDSKLKELAPLRFTIVNAGFKSQSLLPEGNETPKWRTMTLTFERDRTIYLEIIDRSRTGHIVVDEIVFSDSKEPPTTNSQDSVAQVVSDVDKARCEALLKQKAELEAQVPDSEFATVAEDYQPHNVRLHVRGNHKNLAEEVPRGALSIVGKLLNAPAGSSGRLQLAEWLADGGNPLVARVMVNRIWKHHFGQGIVRSTDNFGKMGEAPSHPELLDYLAARFVADGWSVKKLHRQILLSDAYARSSTESAEARKTDPQNRLLQHMAVQRLEAEAIRDSMLSISGSLDRTLFGPSIAPFISSWQEGRGKPQSGPLDGNGRRSIYIQVRRNFMTPLFLAFDYPVPISTIGSRTVSTVPSQALMMMNNEFIAQQAKRWATRTIATSGSVADRIRSMYEDAFARVANGEEITKIQSFVEGQGSRPEIDIWADVAHVLLNSPELIYLQ